MLFSSTRISGSGSSGGGTITSITGVLSVATTPSPITSTGNIQLVNDTVSPGNSAYYGTDSGGTRGWFALSGAISPAGSIGDIQIAGMGGVFAAVSGFNISASELNVPRDLVLGFMGGAGRLLQMEANSSGSGTDFTIKGSNGNGVSSDGGNLVFVAGTKGGIGGVDGKLYLRDPSTGNNALLDTSSMVTGHTYTFPDHSLIFDNITSGTTTSLTGLLKGGAGIVSVATAGTDYLASVNTDSTLTGAGTSGSPLGLLLTTSNTWTPSQGTNFRQNGIATTPTTSVFAENSTASTSGVPVQISPALEFKGHMFKTGAGSADHTGTFRIYQIPVSASSNPGTTAGTLQIDSSKDGVYATNIFSLDKGGSIANAGAITSQGGITSLSTITSGSNGGAGGALSLQGSTSGSLLLGVPAIITSYNLTFPSAQGALNQTLLNDGSGNLSWVSPGLIQGKDRQTAQTGSVALATYTVGATDSSYLVSSNVNITASTAFSFGVICTYTDETNTSRVLNLSFSNLAGTFLQTITNVLGAGAYEGIPLHIRAKAGTTIVISSTGTFTTVTYNIEEMIQQIS